MRKEHDRIWESGTFDEKRGGVSNIDVQQAKSSADHMQSAINKYEETILNWEDGKTSQISGSYANGTFKTVTLKNGDKAYQNTVTNEYFEVGMDPATGFGGFPGKKINIEL